MQTCAIELIWHNLQSVLWVIFSVSPRKTNFHRNSGEPIVKLKRTLNILSDGVYFLNACLTQSLRLRHEKLYH